MPAPKSYCNGSGSVTGPDTGLRSSSGGQMQRVAIARALVARPSIVLADEPTGNLDGHSSTEVLDLLRSLSDEDGTAVVMVTHDQNAASYGSRELHLADGRASEVDTAPVTER